MAHEIKIGDLIDPKEIENLQKGVQTIEEFRKEYAELAKSLNAELKVRVNTSELADIEKKFNGIKVIVEKSNKVLTEHNKATEDYNKTIKETSRVLSDRVKSAKENAESVNQEAKSVSEAAKAYDALNPKVQEQLKLIAELTGRQKQTKKEISDLDKAYRDSGNSLDDYIQKRAELAALNNKQSAEIKELNNGLKNLSKETKELDFQVITSQEEEYFAVTEKTKSIVEELRSDFERLKVSIDIEDVLKQVNNETLTYNQATSKLSSNLRAIEVVLLDYDKALADGTISQTEYNNSIKELNSLEEQTKATYDSIKESQIDLRNSYSEVLSQAEKFFSAENYRLIELKSQMLQSIDETIVALSKLEVRYKNGSIKVGEYSVNSSVLNSYLKTQNDSLKKINKEIDLNNKVVNTAVGSYQNYSAQFDLISMKIDSLSESETYNGQTKQELQAHAKSLYETMKELKKEVGLNQLNVGNYGNSVRDLTNTVGFLNPALAKTITNANNLRKAFVALIANPVVATIAAIVGAITALVAIFTKSISAVSKTEEGFTNLQQAMAPLRVIADNLNKVFEGLGQTFTKVTGWVTTLIAKTSDFLGITDDLAEKAEKYAQIEGERLEIQQDSRELNEKIAKEEKEIAELRDKVAQKDKYNAEERIEMLDKAIEKEKGILDEETRLAARRLQLIDEEIKARGLQDNTEWKDKRSQALVDLENIEAKSLGKQRSLNRERSNLVESINSDIETKTKKHEENIRRIENETTITRAKLEENELQRQIKTVEATYQEKASKIKGNSEKENELRILYQKAQEKEISEIIYKYEVEREKERLQIRLSQIKGNSKEEIDERMNINLQLNELLREQSVREAERAGKDVELVNDKYDQQFLDAVNKAADERIKLVQETAATESIVRNQALLNDLKALEISYQKREITTSKYEKEQLRLRQQFSVDNVQAVIDMYEEMLDSTDISEQTRYDITKKLDEARANLRAVETQNFTENLKNQSSALQDWVADNENYVKEIINIYSELGNVFSGVFDRQIQELETLSDEISKTYDDQIAKIDRLALTEEEAEARKRAAKAETEAKEEELQAKIGALKSKQAKIDKTNNIAQTIINTAVAVMKVWNQLGVFGGPVAAALVAAVGAAQVATIAAQPIPKYAEGTKDNAHPGGHAIVGDGGRKEVIATDGKFFLTPNKPTLVDLPKGAKVFKSEDAFNRYYSGVNALMTMPGSQFPEFVFNSNNGGVEKLMRENNQHNERMLKEMAKSRYYNRIDKRSINQFKIRA